MLRWPLWSIRHVNVECGNLWWRLEGKGNEEEEERERRDRKQKTVTGARFLAGNLVATQPLLQRGWLFVSSVKSLFQLSIKTCVSAARDSNSWVGLLTRCPDDEQGVCNIEVQQDVRIDWWKFCYTPDTMDIPGSQCNVEKNRLIFRSST